MATKTKIPDGRAADKAPDAIRSKGGSAKATAAHARRPPADRAPQASPARSEDDGRRTKGATADPEPESLSASDLRARQLRARQQDVGKRPEKGTRKAPAKARASAYLAIADRLVKAWRSDARAAADLHHRVEFLALAEVLGRSEEIDAALARIVGAIRDAGYASIVRAIAPGPSVNASGHFPPGVREQLAHYGQVVGHLPPSLPRIGDDETAEMRWLLVSW
ncbi:MAG: hypothetical protein JWM10_3475 [Myxococcaceae bacterium]|nr:hypothetical protein [Myxococcaceae bacterium]